ncbi:Imm32 family immunity protein [Parachlamydia acanthamoebae]|uniref:Imm32 family immunity protein n=1 Tax=Parachlamydia acanthamoebae TaxID=83552 RepID=UPI0001C17541|nr:hypothetical protein [Parachlamydia acanthamoebae]EFB40823.1 hypothetical protein pah_c184o001 [Parachlamydia acanthamoebae str. Hall's coccus]
MEIKLDIPDYDKKSFKFKWEPGFEIEVKYEDDVVILTANSAGLISLANHFLNLAQEKIPKNCHFHLDEYNSLEKGSIELIVQKK